MHLEIRLKTLTPLWTGGVDQTCDRLHETGLIGSLRWWYEALVRGLGGYACDPTADGRCEYDPKKPAPPEKQLCAACYLFGCTGWARKFRLRVLSTPEFVSFGNLKAIEAKQTIDIQFIPLRPIAEEEWCLLQLTLRLIAEHGAIGGKTVFKPSDEKSRESQFHHVDFGLVEYVSCPNSWQCGKTLDDLRAYVQNSRWRKDFDDSAFSWASLQNFWCVKGWYLARQDANTSRFNQVIGRRQAKNRAQQLALNNAQNQWLAGRQQESKKVFSFKNPAHTFGFINPCVVNFDEMKARLKKVWPNFDADKEFLTGEQILQALFAPEGGKQ